MRPGDKVQISEDPYYSGYGDFKGWVMPGFAGAIGEIEELVSDSNAQIHVPKLGTQYIALECLTPLLDDDGSRLTRAAIASGSGGVGGPVSYGSTSGIGQGGRDFETKDSGVRQHFETGSQRDSRDGKGRYDLLPPYALGRVAKVYERGAKKYDDRNWEKGQPLCRFLDSALRHTFQALEGNVDEDHAAQAIFNLLGFIEIQHRIESGLLPKELDDMP